LFCLVLYLNIQSSGSLGGIPPDNALIWLGVWRIVLGIGVGGDHPMSASVTADRTNIRKRGTMLAYIFANQGLGSLVGSLVSIVVLSIYKPVMEVEGHTSKVDGGAFYLF
jgi:PHS family inorganic phosphate transporter-like MFS transporter